MIHQLLQIILVVCLFIVIKASAWYVTEKTEGLPFLNYEPYVCFKCLGFWSLLGTFLTIGIIFKLWITLIVGVVVTILDVIAVIVDERKKIKAYKDYIENNADIK